jgi:ribosomal protein S18 acetylase RimI-like enzyme
MPIRRAQRQDEAFLAQMLVAAAFWRVDGPSGSVEEVLARPELAHYLAGWPRPGDLGVIEVDDTTGEPVGAAWLRFLDPADPGYGFVDEATPELTIGVRAGSRGAGVGGRLLEALLGAARSAGIAAVSLSVEPDNYALQLYARHGFQAVGGNGGSTTMLRVL